MTNNFDDDPPVMDGAGWAPNDSKKAAKAHAQAIARAQGNPKAPAWGRVWERADVNVERFGARVAWMRAPRRWAAQQPAPLSADTDDWDWPWRLVVSLRPWPIETRLMSRGEKATHLERLRHDMQAEK